MIPALKKSRQEDCIIIGVSLHYKSRHCVKRVRSQVLAPSPPLPAALAQHVQDTGLIPAAWKVKTKARVTFNSSRVHKPKVMVGSQLQFLLTDERIVSLVLADHVYHLFLVFPSLEQNERTRAFVFNEGSLL